ncbi:unnamed protein product [Brassica rapa]|uniref:Uncharacterized protein n=1 Tax=Brassica campestris TaxID=3711 RepID=A0A8D9DGZ5_BRACM|nr:unnamed protein product [Brassica rapa]
MIVHICVLLASVDWLHYLSYKSIGGRKKMNKTSLRLYISRIS